MTTKRVAKKRYREDVSAVLKFAFGTLQEERRKKSLEEGWNDSYSGTKMTEYNALFDPNMRHFFESPSVQDLLLRTGQIDRNGRVIDLQKQKGKLHIIEQEFKQAEKIEYWREKEERDMRDRVQKKRALALEHARREEMVKRHHEDRRIRQEIIRASLEAHGIPTGTREHGKGVRSRRHSWTQGAERIRHFSHETFREASPGKNERVMAETFITEGDGGVADTGVDSSIACNNNNCGSNSSTPMLS